MTSRRNLLIAAVVLVVIVLVVVASYFMSTTTEQESSVANQPASEPTQTSEHGFPVSPLRLGEGGSQTAADGQTRIGYIHSCDDAVRAAVNYIAADSVAAEGWDGRERTLKHILATNNARTEYIDALRSIALEDHAVSDKSLFDPPIFNLVSCEPGKSASVAVAQRIETNPYKIGEKTVPASVEIRVANQQMAWEGNDWKLDVSALYSRPEAQLLYREEIKEPSTTDETLAALFTDSDGNPITRDGWMELAR